MIWRRHPSLDVLAGLAEGRLNAPEAEDTRRHVASCKRCLDDFIAAVAASLHEHDQTPTPDAALIAEGVQAASAPGIGGQRRRFAVRAKSAARRRLRFVVPAAGTIALAGLATALVLGRGARHAPDMAQLAGVSLEPLRGAVREMSAYAEGALVVPGGEGFADAAPSPALRSAGGTLPPVREALAQLEDLEAKGGMFSPHLGYWLGVAYLAVGDQTTARIHLDQALRRYPDNLDLLLLDAVHANRVGELRQAERQLRRVLELHPRHRLAHVNLGLLLVREPARRGEAVQVLNEVARGADDALGARARRALEQLSSTAPGT